jgi:hypothetical protein
LARSFAIDTEDKSKKDILAEIKAKTMDGRYDAFVDSFEDPGEYVHTPPPSTESEEPSEESSEEPSEESSEEPSEESSEEPSEESIKQVK